MHRWASGKNCSIKVWSVTWLKKVQRKKVIWRERRKLQQKRMYR